MYIVRGRKDAARVAASQRVSGARRRLYGQRLPVFEVDVGPHTPRGERSYATDVMNHVYPIHSVLDRLNVELWVRELD